jgi:hypothetical protein
LGERVFTIENPGKQKDKKLTTGVISKADAEEIVTDVKISYVGSPLFNSSGKVVGIIQKKEQGMRVQPIVNASGILAEARQKLPSSAPPPAQFLPVVPPDLYPTDNLRAPGRDRWEKDIYSFQAGDFFVELSTPIAIFEAQTERYAQALKNYGKRSQGPPPTEPERKYESVLVIAVVPKTKTPFWENVGNGQNRPIVKRYKTAFEKMRLMCGDKEVTPIWPGRVAVGVAFTRNAIIEDESSGGRYVYLPDAISPQCGKVTLQIVSSKEKESGQTVEKVFEETMVERMWQDFEPYRKMQAKPAGTAAPQ